jgi:hypothetical protein
MNRKHAAVLGAVLILVGCGWILWGLHSEDIGATPRSHKKHNPAPNSATTQGKAPGAGALPESDGRAASVKIPELKWYDVTVGDLECQLAVPTTDVDILRRGYFDLSSPIAAAMTETSLRLNIASVEDLQRLFLSVFQDGKERYADAMSQYPTKQMQADMIESLDKFKTTQLRLLGMFRITLSSGCVLYHIKARDTLSFGGEYAGKTSQAITVFTVSQVGDKWLRISEKMEASPEWAAIKGKLIMYGAEPILKCRKAAGVEPYEDLLDPQKGAK